jgi:hypothetical protein
MTKGRWINIEQATADGVAKGLQCAKVNKCADCGAAARSPRSSYCEKHFDERLKVKIQEDY